MTQSTWAWLKIATGMGTTLPQLEAGWHSVSLQYFSNGRGISEGYAPQEAGTAVLNGPTTGFKYDPFRQARVWARSMRYIALRHKVEG